MSGWIRRTVYGHHLTGVLRLDAAERAIIASLSAPVHIFWHPVLRLAVTNASNWPEDRVEVPANSNRSFVSAVFVTYHSVLQPLSNLGNVGDLWLTPNVLFWKEHKDRWLRWTPLSVYRCPFDPTRRTRLVFSHMAEFKYVGTETENSEYIKWKTLGVPESCIPTFLRERIPGVTAAINRDRYDLQEIDMVFLYNIRLDFIRLGFAMCILAQRQGEAVAMGQNTITQGHVQQTCISPRVREDGAGQRAHPHEEAVESITSHDQLQLQEAEQDMDHPRLDDSDEEVDLLLDEGRDSSRPLALPSTQSRELHLQSWESSRFGEHEDTEVGCTLKETGQQLKEHTSVIHRLVETMDAHIEAGDQEWLDRNTSELRILALVASDILSKRDPAQTRTI